MLERLALEALELPVSPDSRGKDALALRLSDRGMTDWADFSGMYSDTLGPLPGFLRDGFRLLGWMGTEGTSPFRLMRTLGLCTDKLASETRPAALFSAERQTSDRDSPTTL